MKFLDEYRREEDARRFVEAIGKTVTRPWTLMEVCGGQTHTLIRTGIDRMLPESLTVVHGPGCPVCVTPLEMIDRSISIAEQPGVILTSFGDMLRVPGSRTDLLHAKARGADVRMVYSPLDALKLASSHPDRQVVFFAVGFETTAPANAMAVWRAKELGLDNFSILCAHVLVPPAMRAILGAPGNQVRGFLAAGHVCTVMGYEEYEPIAEQYGVPIVVTGFETLDLLQGIHMTVQALEQNRSGVENQYARAVRREGNPHARELLSRVFEVCDRPWRGIGTIPASGFRLRPELAWFDAERRFGLGDVAAEESPLCIAGEILRGLKKPCECTQFASGCTPERPLGAPMVSSEGACAAYYRYGEKPMSADGPDDLSQGAQCPLPISDYPAITMAHGGGGRLSQMLVEKLFLPSFRNAQLEELHDGALIDVEGSRLAFSTDSFVVQPLFFPGGDIGSLAVHGTVNDLAMCAARPVAISAGLILEEGFPMEELWRVTRSMKQAAESVGVPIVTGDTKVVDRGKGDGVFINTTGIGVVRPGVEFSPRRARPGDAVLVSGTIAVHGIAIMSVREGLEFETKLESDSAPLHDLVDAILEAAGDQVHVLRDPTRGGVASALNEIAARARVGIRLDESVIPVGEEVRGACEILGLDPLYVANEGKCLAITSREAADAVLWAMRGHPLGGEAAVIGEVVEEHPGQVLMRSRIGGMRIVDMLSGEQLPRIC